MLTLIVQPRWAEELAAMLVEYGLSHCVRVATFWANEYSYQIHAADCAGATIFKVETTE